MFTPHIPHRGAQVAPWYARSYEQYAQMRENLEHGVCPFCALPPESSPAIWTGKHLFAKKNDFPRKHETHSIVIVTHEHIEHPRELPPEAGAELWQIVAELSARYNWIGGGLSMRFGELWNNAGTIKHLHMQIQIPDPDNPGKSVATFAKDPAKMEEDLIRARAFEDQYRAEHGLPPLPTND